MKTVLKTITLGRDEPSFILCPGHVNPRTFNDAMRSEGWTGGGSYTEDDLKHEWWMTYTRLGKTYYKRVDKDHKKAKPFTFTMWD